MGVWDVKLGRNNALKYLAYRGATSNIPDEKAEFFLNVEVKHERSGQILCHFNYSGLERYGRDWSRIGSVRALIRAVYVNAPLCGE